MAIGKVNKNGGNIGGLIQYVFSASDHKQEVRDEVRQIAGTMSARTKSSLKAEFEAIQSLRPSLGQNTLHWSISFPKDEVPSRETMGKIAEHICEKMGVQAWIAVSHGDHFHIAGSRVNTDGSVVSDSLTKRRLEPVIREIEQMFGLRQVASSHLHDDGRKVDHQKLPDIQKLYMHDRLGTVVPEIALQAIIEDVLARQTPISATEFIEAMELQGVDVRPNVASTGKLSGFAYGFDGQSYTSKQLGKGYTLASLTKKGLTYEPDRDLENCRRAAERSAEKRHTGSDGPAEGTPTFRDIQPTKPELAQPNSIERNAENPGKIVPGYPSFSSGDQGDDGPSRDAREGAQEDDRESLELVEREDGRDREAVSEVIERPAEPAPQGAISAPRDDAASSVASPGSEGVRSGSSDLSDKNAGSSRTGSSGGGGGTNHGSLATGVESGDIAAIAGDDFNALSAFFKAWAAGMRKQQAASRGVTSKSGAGISGPETSFRAFEPHDGGHYDRLMNLAGTGRHARTEQAIIQQLKAFGVSQYEVQAIPPKDADPSLKPDSIRTLTAEEVIKYRSYFAAKNMQGYDIYVRPKPFQNDQGNMLAAPYIFVDDLKADQIKKLDEIGLPLAVQVESSTGNFHGWVRVADHYLKPELATMAAQTICKAIGGDPGAADWRHYGRLAGFTNQKQSRRKADGKAPYALVTTPKNGHSIAPNGAALLAAAQQKLDRQHAAQEQARQAVKAAYKPRAGADRNAYDDVAEAWNKHHAGDKSATDYAAALSALGRGHEVEDVAQALRHVSPDLDRRKGRYADDYVRRTVEKANQRHLQSQGTGPRMR